MSVRIIVIHTHTHADRAITQHSFFTKENAFHSLAEEPLTLFPDVVRCPLSTAASLPAMIVVALGFGDERELVGGGDGC